MSETLHDRLVDILGPHMREVRPPGELAAARAMREAISSSGEIKPGALPESAFWQPRDFIISGAVPIGTNVAAEYRVRQPSRLVYLDATAKTAPSGGPLTARVTIRGGASLQNVSIRAGSREGFSTANESIPAGALIVLAVDAANGARDATVTAWLVPDIR